MNLMIWRGKPKFRQVYNGYPNKADLEHGEVPIFFDPFRQIDESQRYHPILQRGRIGIKGKYLQVNRIELIYSNGCLRVRVEIFEKLFQNGVNSRRRLW